MDCNGKYKTTKLLEKIIEKYHWDLDLGKEI